MLNIHFVEEEKGKKEVNNDNKVNDNDEKDESGVMILIIMSTYRCNNST